MLRPLDTGEFVQVGESDPPLVAASTAADAPMVLSVTPSDLLLTDVDVGSPFSLDVLFDEEMTVDGSADPMLTFDPIVGSTLTLNSGTWSSDGLVYTATYDVADVNINVSNVDVSVSGAMNLNEHLQLPSTRSTPRILRF